MSRERTPQASNGIGFAGALFLVFLVLKLTHQIDWSWWWITAPLWAGTALVLAIVGVIGAVWLVARAVNRVRGEAASYRRQEHPR